MSTVARRFCSVPARLSSATWKAISGLISKGDTTTAAEFAKISGIASCLINDKLLAENPMVVKNKGPRLRVYCLYGEDAVTGEDKNEEALTWNPTAEEWHVFLPCTEEEFDETAAALKASSAKFSAYNIEKGIPDDGQATAAKSEAQAATVDWGAFKNL